MNNTKVKSFASWAVIGVLGLAATAGAALALGGSFPIGIDTCNDCLFTVSSDSSDEGGEQLGAGTRFPSGLSADGTSPSSGEVRGTTLTITGDASFSGALTGVTTTVGALSYTELYDSIAAASSTLTAALSGQTTYISGATSTIVLPATSTAAGTVYRVVVGGALTGDTTVVTDNGAETIEGSLIVAGAVVDCDAEDTLTFHQVGANVGDFVELRSDGANWYLGATNALTSGKLTCSAS